MRKKKVLFICVHNSARSQMAEAFLNHYGHNHFEAESAGLEPGNLNPVVVEVMREAGFDISGNPVDSVFDFFRQGRLYAYVITVCDANRSEKCPIFPGAVIRQNWSFDDPSDFTGTQEEKLEKTRMVRAQIKKRVLQFINEEGH
ncbi:MAG: arsenate reductase ArsC [Bacillota bacterium]|nr:arsenate reductase ArsC [Bacillota bacterium]